MLLVLVKNNYCVCLLIIISNSFFSSFFSFCLFAGIFAGVKEREKKKVGFVVTAEEVHPLTPGDS
jgi:hypothetical protein